MHCSVVSCLSFALHANQTNVTTFAAFLQISRADLPNLHFGGTRKLPDPGKNACAIDDLWVCGYNRNERAA